MGYGCYLCNDLYFISGDTSVSNKILGLVFWIWLLLFSEVGISVEGAYIRLCVSICGGGSGR